MKRFLPIIIALALIFPSCASGRVSPYDVLRAVCDAEAGLPAGTFYSTDANEESPEFLRPELLAVAYGIPLDFDGIEGAAIRLSGKHHPAELAVFLCKDANAVEDVVLFCHQRIKALIQNSDLSAAVCGMSAEEYKEYVSGATVISSGRYVALIISSDPRYARRAFLKAV